MHGNESTTTKALLDFWIYLKSKEAKPLLDACTFLMIPQLNPDGSDAYTRLNANGVDLNRDAIDLTQPESMVLRKIYEDFNPDYCFNLHGQRTIFAAGNTHTPATVSFLAPAADPSRTITPARELAMKLIVAANTRLQESISNAIGRYDDGFNINCVGDYFISQNTPTILFEAGHFDSDYKRIATRGYIFEALVTMCKTIANGSIESFSVDSYFEIPENYNHLRDIELYNLRQTIGGSPIFNNKLFIQFREEKKEDDICFIPELSSMDSTLIGLQRVNAQEYDEFKDIVFDSNSDNYEDLTKTFSLLSFNEFL